MIAAIFELVETKVVLAIAALAIAVWDLRGKPDQLSIWCLASYWGTSYWELKSNATTHKIHAITRIDVNPSHSNTSYLGA